MTEIRLLFLSWFTTQLVRLACIEGLAAIRKVLDRIEEEGMDALDR